MIKNKNEQELALLRERLSNFKAQTAEKEEESEKIMNDCMEIMKQVDDTKENIRKMQELLLIKEKIFIA